MNMIWNTHKRLILINFFLEFSTKLQSALKIKQSVYDNWNVIEAGGVRMDVRLTHVAGYCILLTY